MTRMELEPHQHEAAQAVVAGLSLAVFSKGDAADDALRMIAEGGDQTFRIMLGYLVSFALEVAKLKGQTHEEFLRELGLDLALATS